MADRAVQLSLVQARRTWLTRQRLVTPAAPAEPSPATPRVSLSDTVAAVGWVPVPVGATAYLALLARGALTTRAALDEATFQRNELAVVPGPRGSSWLVPSGDAPLARAFAVADHASREARVASACALTARDLEGTREALRATLERPVTATELRAMLPESALRSLGEVGRKAGSTTLAGLVLRGMWILGEVLRLPVEGRLDRERYRYALDPRPRIVPTAAEAVDLVAPRWLSAHAPTTAKAFATALGIAAGRAQAALRPLRPVSLEIDSLGGGYLAPADFVVPEPPPEGVINFLPLRDPLLDANPTLAGLASASVARAAQLRNLGPAPSVLCDGEILGLWTYDEATQRVAWRALGPAPTELATRLSEAALHLGSFIAGELGAAPLHGAQAARRPPLPTGEIGLEF